MYKLQSGNTLDKEILFKEKPVPHAFRLFYTKEKLKCS